MSELQPVTPARLDYVVKNCLSKVPDDRWQSAADVGRKIKGIVEGESESSLAASVTARPGRWRPAVLASLATFLLGGTIVGIAVWGLTRTTFSPRQLERFYITRSAYLSGARATIAISPNGSRAVYKPETLERRRGFGPLHVRVIDELASRPLQGTAGDSWNPFFSPNSDWVGFFEGRDDSLKKVSLRGGPVSMICSGCAEVVLGASWGEEDTIIFGNRTPSPKTSASGMGVRLGA